MCQSRVLYQICKVLEADRPEGFRSLIFPRGWCIIIILEYPLIPDTVWSQQTHSSIILIFRLLLFHVFCMLIMEPLRRHGENK